MNQQMIQLAHYKTYDKNDKTGDKTHRNGK